MPTQELIGCSPKFRGVLDKINMVAPVDCAVLIQGETGTGKEVIAQAIHAASPRRQNRFVASIARQFRAPCWRASSSGTKEALSRAPSIRPSGAFRRPTGARYFLTKLAIFLLSCNQNFSAFSRSSSLSAWAAAAPNRSTCG